MEADSVAPPSTEPRTPFRIFWNVLFSCCPARISRHCTSGKPASIITENWRVKMASSFESTPPPKVGMLNSFPFSESLLTLICSLRNVAASSALVVAVRSPATVAPVRLTPRYVNTGMVCYLLFLFNLLPTDGRFAGRRRRNDSTVDQVLQFVWVRGPRQRHFQSD